jgi:hypothetical protein
MSPKNSTSPSDLAITFRSVPRRLREATGDGDAGGPHGEAVATHLATAARLLGTTAEANAIADAIDARPADQWDDALLDGLREVGLSIGSALRAMAAANDQDHER